MPRVAVGLTDGTVSASSVLPACATRPLATPRAATTPRVTVGVVYATPTALLRRGLASWAGLVRCYADGPDVWPSAHLAIPVVYINGLHLIFSHKIARCMNSGRG